MDFDEHDAGVIGNELVEKILYSTGLWFGTIRETATMAHEVFGVCDRNPAAPLRDMTREELERYLLWTEDYQRRLKADRHAQLGPPEGKSWPPNPDAPPSARLTPPAEEEVVD